MDTAMLQNMLENLSNEDLIRVVSEVLEKRPECAPGVVAKAVPDLTYAPAEALCKRRSSGTIKKFDPNVGFGFIQCPELKAVFGNDVYLHKNQIGPWQTGQEVSFGVLLGKDLKPQAFDLQPVGGSPFPGVHQSQASQGCWGSGSYQSWGKGGSKGYDSKGCGCGGPQSWSGGCGGDLGSGKGGDLGYGGKAWGGCGGGCDGYGPYGGGDFGCGGKGAKSSMKPPRTLSTETKPDVQQVLGDYVGMIKSYNQAQGYGFIECEALKQQGYTNDVYLHHSQIKDFTPNSQVAFTVYLNRKGQPQAMDLQPTG